MINLVCEPFNDIIPIDNYWIENSMKSIKYTTLNYEEGIELFKSI